MQGSDLKGPGSKMFFQLFWAHFGLKTPFSLMHLFLKTPSNFLSCCGLSSTTVVQMAPLHIEKQNNMLEGAQQSFQALKHACAPLL